MITSTHINDPKIKFLIDDYSKINYDWKNTAFENYHTLSNNKKGSVGELFVENYMRDQGSIVTPKINSGHDRVIDGYKTEIKFSLSHHINHLSTCKDWERCIAIVLNPVIEKSIFIWFTKEKFIEYATTTDVFRPQAGGYSKGNTNDDYWIDSTKRLQRFIALDGINNISTWGT